MTINDESTAVTPGWSRPPAMLDVRVSAMVCQICDVTWNDSGGDRCWMCDEPGRRAADAMPWSALAPALFL